MSGGENLFDEGARTTLMKNQRVIMLALEELPTGCARRRNTSPIVSACAGSAKPRRPSARHGPRVGSNRTVARRRYARPAVAIAASAGGID